MEKTGLVLTGGSLRGICGHVGALMALQERGIKATDFDAVIGTSAGAIVGALYCTQPGARTIAYQLKQLRKRDYLDPIGKHRLVLGALRGLRGVSGLYKGDALRNWLAAHIGSSFKIQSELYLTAVNISRRRTEVDRWPVGMYSTPRALARRASASAAIPLGFRPVEVGLDSYCVDGGVTNNIPVDELVKRRPDLERILVITTLNTVPDDQVDNDWLHKKWTPLRLVLTLMDAAIESGKADNLNAGGRPVDIVRVKVPSIGLDEPELIPGAIDGAYQNALVNAELYNVAYVMRGRPTWRT
jgi:predicted acylesterase/phospholipase RssA